MLPAPIYDIHKSYAENLAQGPAFHQALPERLPTPEKKWLAFLGYRVRSPLGVPAGPLLDSRWTTLAAQLGFDIVTYKTIRSQKYAGHPLPNVIFVQPSSQDPQLAHRSPQPAQMERISITNSFGMPSMDQVYLQEDIAKARRHLLPGQLLIVSVVGTPHFSSDVQEDFVRAAVLAKEAGAQVIEANFSCPNISSKEGSLYCDAENAYSSALKLAKAVAPLPLMIKVGQFHNKETLNQVLISLARAGVRGVCGINSVSMRVVNEQKQPALGEGRAQSGVCGSLIRPAALAFVKDASEIIAKERLELELAGCGGIMLPAHFDQFLAAGAKIALCATGMMWDPYLAHKWHQQAQ